MVCTSIPLFAQSKSVSGTIIDTNGEAIIGATVTIVGTKIGTTTDIDGKYTLKGMPVVDAKLKVSYVGYLSIIEPVNSRTIINLTLNEDSQKLNEIVVVGYGTQKKSDITGSLVSVSEKSIKEKPVQNAVDAMQGKAAGVDVVSNVRPGQVSSITIRGARSLSGSNSPLYVVDGIILMGSINDINPSDIGSIEVLKDASATAIYGSRGANGVVLISTKRGQNGKLTINYDGSVSLQNAHSTTKWASAGEALDRTRMANINGGTYPYAYADPFSDITKFGHSDAATIDAIRAGYEWNDPGTFTSVKMRTTSAAEQAAGMPAQVPIYNSGNIPTTDWIKMLTRTALAQNHLISLSSASDKHNLYMSVGYLKNEGIQLDQNYERFTSKVNGEITPVKWLKVGTSLNLSSSKQKYGSVYGKSGATGASDLYGIAIGQYLMAKPYDADGNIVLYPGGNKSLPVWNPYINLENTDDQTNVTNILANLYVEGTITPWLKYRTNFGSGFNFSRSGSWQGSQSSTRRTANPQTAAASYKTSENFQYMLENIFYVNKTFGVHTFGATLMQSAQTSENRSESLSSSKILSDASKWYNLSYNLNGNPDHYGTGYSKTTMMSYMGRINYNLMDKYLLTATGRYDGSSVLANGHKWAFFPSFALGWNAKSESFLENVGWLSQLKLRYGYGVTGNSAIGPYTTMGPLSQYNYTFGTTIGSGIGQIPYKMANNNLTWEKTAQSNIGVDFGVLQGRIHGSVDIYTAQTHDVLMSQSIPSIIGYTSTLANIGKTQNNGIEITLSAVPVQTKDFSWSVDFNWSKNTSKIVELVNGKEDMPGNGWYIGQPLGGVFRTYELNGLWQNTPSDLAEIAKWKTNGFNFSPGQYKPVDQDGDYKLTDADKVIRGTTQPKWIAGLTNTFDYNDFELTIFTYARIGQSYISNLTPGSSTDSYIGYVRSAAPDEFWSPTNIAAKYPQPTTGYVNASVTQASYINNGSFIAIRNIGLSYNVPQKVLTKLSVKKLQVYTQVANPLLFGSDVVKAGINPQDTGGWTSVNSLGELVGGTNNNTVLYQSFVFGMRFGF